MSVGKIEHINITVKDPKITAAMLGKLFGWHIRWQGEAISGGFTIHVGTDDQYLAVYTGPTGKAAASAHTSYAQLGGLNHVGVVVDDFEATEKCVLAAGFTPGEHYDYEPGRRFYFRDSDNIEYEVISYV
ncbi:MAG: VOC family protein [Paracoccaceae bacterium]